jgi:hypothetical protein
MDAMEKARIRLEHWIEHNDQHQREYETFAQELVRSGKTQSAEFVQEMITLNAKATGCLRKALQTLKEEK